jgi:hypothetical protein
MLMEIDKLRRIAECCLSGRMLDNELSSWLGRSLEAYLAREASSLEAALGLRFAKGGVPWWLEERIRRRDEALRGLARRYFGAVSVTERAREIHRLARRYAASAWRFDSEAADMPDGYQGTVKEWLWQAFKSGASMPLSERQLRNIFAD